MHTFVQGLSRLFQKNANSEQAAGAKAYMRHQFEFFGLRAQLWRNLLKEYSRENLPPFFELPEIIHELWKLPERELQLAGVELAAMYKREWGQEIIRLFEYMITEKSWWDTVDHIASELTGPYFKKFPEKIITVTGKWNRSENIWLQRSSLMFQKQYKKDTDFELLSAYILHLKDSKEFFIQKGIGWALREYSKTNPETVKKFVKQNTLATLSKREALKRIS